MENVETISSSLKKSGQQVQVYLGSWIYKTRNSLRFRVQNVDTPNFTEWEAGVFWEPSETFSLVDHVPRTHHVYTGLI